MHQQLKKSSSGLKVPGNAPPSPSVAGFKSAPSTPTNAARGGPLYENKNKIFVGKLTNLCANLEEVLTNHFSQYGVVIAVELPPLPDGTSSTNTIGFAFVTLKDADVVSKLIAKQWETVLGRQVEIKPYTLTNTSSAFLVRQNEAVKATLEIPAKADKQLVVEELKNPGMLAVGKSSTWTVRVRNNYSSEKQITNILFLVNKPEFQLVDVSNDPKKNLKRIPFNLEAGGSFSFGVNFDPRHRFFGIYRAPLAVCFKDFYTLKEIVVKVTDPEALQKLVPTVKFIPVEIDEIQRKIIPAFPPSRVSTTHFHTPIETPYVVPIPEYPIPENVQAPVDMGKTPSDSNLWKNKENHVARLHRLLYIEEAQQKKNLRKFDLKEVTMDRVTSVMLGKKKQPPPEPCMRLFVPGLAEQRPSVLTGDSVYAWLPGTEDYEYEGCVWRVEEKAVLLMFCVDFEHLFPPTTKFNVRFSFNRMHMRYMHRAVDATDLSIIWPSATSPAATFQIREELAKNSKRLSASADSGIASKEKASKQEPEEKLKVLDKDINDNQAQLRAVDSVTYGRHKHVPFLLFGSFGTGKTKTLVEMVRQVLKVTKNPHILICAHVNSSVDLIVEKLAAYLTSEKMFRLFAFHRSLSSVASVVQTYTKITTTSEKTIFDVPPLADLLKFQVIVTTTMTSATLYGVGVGQEHFTHIFIDEAAQTMEPEALIPLAMAKYGQTRVIMSGDDQQLGPKVYSPSCRHHGLAMSIMERMVTQGVYNNRSDSHTSASLFTIYRSHPLISAIPSHLFYGGKLKSKVVKDPAKVTLSWSTLNNNFPVFFYGVEGQDAQEGDSPSFFNPEEALALVNFVQNMLQEMKVEERDICVISAYSKQVKVIRELLRSQCRLYNVNVGGVDEMQGREYKVVIISTVRAKDSWHKWKSFDTQHHLGFISDPKRLNTAITRAQSLLVFVGDPYVLYRDPSFRYIIEYCVENNNYQNVPLKQVKEWREPAAPTTTPSKPFAWGAPPTANGTATPPNGTPNETPNGTPNGTPKEIRQSPNGTQKKASDQDNSTNQDSEDMFVAASRVLTQHAPVESKGASVAAPTHSATQAYHKDQLLSVLDRFFDPAHPASGRDPSVLAPLFVQAQVAEYIDELAQKIVESGTQVGRDESIRAVGVLKVLAEIVPTLSDSITNIIAQQLVKLRTNIFSKQSTYTGIFLGSIYKEKLISKSPHALLVYLVPEGEAQNGFLAEVIAAMTEILGKDEVLLIIESLKWDLAKIFNKSVLQLAKFLREKKLQFLTPDLPETVNITPQATSNPAPTKGRGSPVGSPSLRVSAPSFVPTAVVKPTSSVAPIAPPVSAPTPITIPSPQPLPLPTSNSNSNSLFEHSPVPNPRSSPIPHDTSSFPHSSSPQSDISPPNLMYPQSAFSNPNFPNLPLPTMPNLPNLTNFTAMPNYPTQLPLMQNLHQLQHFHNLQTNFNMGNFSRGPQSFNPLLGSMPYPYLNPYMNYNLAASLSNGGMGPQAAFAGPIDSPLSETSEPVVTETSEPVESTDEVPMYTSNNAGLDCLCEYEGNQLIVVKSGSLCPPLSVFLEGENIRIEICVFNLDVNVSLTGNLLYVDLQTKERTKQAQYVLPTMRSLHDDVQKQGKRRGREGTRLVIGIPEHFQRDVETKKGEYVLMLILKPQTIPVMSRLIPTVINDAVM